MRYFTIMSIVMALALGALCYQLMTIPTDKIEIRKVICMECGEFETKDCEVVCY